jgi:Na+/H+-dicarboxylate symporter
VAIGFGLASLVQPGTGIAMPAGASFKPAVAPAMADVLIGIVAVNPFAALAEGNMLQIIFIAMLAGLAIAWVGEPAAPLLQGLKALDLVVQRMVHIVMLFAPVGVFGLMAKVVIGQGTAVFLPLLKYILVVFGGLLLHALVVYPAYLAFLGRLNPLRFYSRVYPAMLVAFSTSSSSATLPGSMAVARMRLGVREDIYSFTLPLGATINMDGTAIMRGVATVFVANVYGIALGPAEFLQVALMATLASIGTAGVPGAGVIMLSMVLAQVGLPIEGIAIILGIDRLVDMGRTVLNVMGDLMATAVVARSEGALNLEAFAGTGNIPARW